MSNHKLRAITLGAITLGLLIAWGVVRFFPCETREPTPAPWPTILERDDHEIEAMAVDLAGDQASDSPTKGTGRNP